MAKFRAKDVSRLNQKLLDLIKEGKGEAEMRVKFPFVAGILIRADVRSSIKTLAFMADVKISLEEDKGWLDSTFRVEVEGKVNDMHTFLTNLSNYFERLS